MVINSDISGIKSHDRAPALVRDQVRHKPVYYRSMFHTVGKQRNVTMLSRPDCGYVGCDQNADI